MPTLPPAYLGLDVGTTATKAIAFGADGDLLAEGRGTYVLHHPAPGAAIQHADEVLRAAEDALKEAYAAVKGEYDVRSIAISCAMHAVILTDGKGNYSPVYTWADTRSAGQAEQLTDEQSHDFHRRTGTPVHPMSPLLTLPWLRDATPDGPLDDYVQWHDLKGLFTGAWTEEGPVIDYQLASATGLYDLSAEDWLPAALTFALGENPALQNPRIVDPRERLTWREDVRGRLFGGADIPLFAGGSDGVLANLGSGILEPGNVAVTIGTSGAIRTTHRQAEVNPAHGLFNYRMLDDRYVVGGATNNGGKVIEYWQNLLSGHYADIPALLEAALDLPDDEDLPTFSPYLYGERAPIYDAAATAGLHCLRGHHDARHVARAVLEGVTGNLVAILSALEEVTGPAQNLLASGGWTRSERWVDLLGRRAGRPIRVVDTPQASAYGAALIGKMALGEDS